MSNYSTKLRIERREELSLRALNFATKSEGDAGNFPSSDYAYVPDPDMPSTWKLRLTSTPGGDPDPSIVGAAIAALGKGFRGNKVEIPSNELSAVKAKVKSAWKKANPDKSEDEMPLALSSYIYEIEIEDTQFGDMPPFMKAGMIKNLEKKLAAEEDDDKKAKIQAQIDKLKGNDKKEEMAAKIDLLLAADSED